MNGDILDDEGPLSAYLRDAAPELGSVGFVPARDGADGSEDGPTPSPPSTVERLRLFEAEALQLSLPFGVVARALALTFGWRAMAASPLPGLVPLAGRATPLFSGPVSPMSHIYGSLCLFALAVCIVTGGSPRTCAALAAPDLLCTVALLFAAVAEAAVERSERALEDAIQRAMYALRVAQAARLGIGLEPGAAPVGRIESARHASGSGLGCPDLRLAVWRACGAGQRLQPPPPDRALLLLSLAGTVDAARQRTVDSAAARYERVLRVWAQPCASVGGVITTVRTAFAAAVASAAAAARLAALAAAFSRQFPSPLRCDRDWVCLSGRRDGDAPPPRDAGAADAPDPVRQALEPLERAAVAALIVSSQARGELLSEAARLLEGLPPGTPGLVEARECLARLTGGAAVGKDGGDKSEAETAGKPARLVGGGAEAQPQQSPQQTQPVPNKEEEEGEEGRADVVEVLEAEGEGEGPDPSAASVADRERIVRPPAAVMDELARAVANGPRDHVHRRVGVGRREGEASARPTRRSTGAQPRVVVQELERALRRRGGGD